MLKKRQKPSVDVTILIDDCASSKESPSSSLLQSPIAHLKATQPNQIASVLSSIQSHQGSGRYVVTLFAYEFGESLQGLTPKTSRIPFVEAFVFDRCLKLSAEETSNWIQNEIKNSENTSDPAGLLNIEADISQGSYKKSIVKIQDHIRQGDTYQVNYTMRLKGAFYGTPIKLYQTLRQRQPVRFGAFIDAGEHKVICLSPELFIAKKKDQIVAQPMKGTLSSMEGPATALSLSPKDRAENLMITDLIRNDLGMICKIGSVRVPELFQVQSVGSIYQMTSTITGELREGIALPEILKATFPCGSITGAPKLRTMELIQELEGSPRGLYCGSIGYFEPNGDFRLNVAIRTMEVLNKNRFQMGVGSGITIDSDPEKEWQECQTKANFIKEPNPSIGLIETMRFENGEIPFLSAHVKRIQKSARALGIYCDQSLLLEKIEHTKKQFIEVHQGYKDGADAQYAVRLELRPNGEISLSARPIEPTSTKQKAFWAADLIGQKLSIMDSQNPLLHHKTTIRRAYDLAWQAAEKIGGFDGVFLNERGEITEGGRSNLFALVQDTWLTPPLMSGVLPGIMREILLSDPHWDAKEKVLFPEDLINAQKIILVNALRGIIEVGRISPISEV